jgi:two-component system response regulator AtoC
MAKVLIVDDERGQREIVSKILQTEGHELFEAENVATSLRMIDMHQPDVVLTDMKMPGKNGLALVEEAHQRPLYPEVVVVTAFGSVETAVKAMQLGAYSYLTKPLERDELVLAVQRAAEKRALRMEGQRLKQELTNQVRAGLIFQSLAMQNVIDIVDRVAESDSTVLIRGESGTGKEHIARLIHHQSSRSLKTMQSINCAAFPETLLESELFGFEKGSFTGAYGRKIGLIEAASGSTLFLDEIADMSPNTQAKLLRVLQEREIRRIGSTVNIPVDVRIIAATNKNLDEAIRSKTFREDLYYRLNVIPIVIPPLRERKEDVPTLVRHFIAKTGRIKSVDSDAMERLCRYDWPGNVRELEAVMERIAVLTPGDKVTIHDLPMELRTGPKRSSDMSWRLPKENIHYEEWEKNLLAQALEESNGIMSKAAKRLGMTYRTFQYRAAKFGLKGQ